MMKLDVITEWKGVKGRKRSLESCLDCQEKSDRQNETPLIVPVRFFDTGHARGETVNLSRT